MMLIQDQMLSRVSFDHGLVLLFGDGSEIRIEVGFSISAGAELSRRVDIGQPADYSSAVVSGLLKHADAEVVKESTLVVRLANEVVLVVAPDTAYEAWTVSRPDGSILVCAPGGELVSWSAG